ncbi:hypothetical protein Tco_0924169 [Tanacetum coccineum]|uniref:Uncharacterized protein n=1 Tax=Tanacetum coccineum TaxID=301880 RepID=A0ABQ5D358_9ASTR
MGRAGYSLVKEKMKETEDKIKEGTLKVDHGTDAMTVVLGKEKGGYARGVGSGVTYKRLSPVEIHPINSSADEEGGTTMLDVIRMMRAFRRKCKNGGMLDLLQVVGSNGCTTVLDAVGGFVAWPKNQVVLDPKATPPSSIQMITGENKTARKVQTKHKNVYVYSDAMQKEANKKRSQKA